MAFYDKFPYTNFQEINLDRIIQELIKVKEGLDFVIENASLKYADPIQWNITKQYAANTVVIDPATGIAYISTKPVPDNILITNAGYWTPIFDLGALFSDLEDKIGDVSDALDHEVTDRGNADITLQQNIDNEQTARENADITLQQNIDNEQTARENADINLQNQINALSDAKMLINVKKYGALGDGATDDSAALNAAFAAAGDEYCTVLFPSGTYMIGSPVNIPSNTTIYFDNAEIKVIRTDSTWKELTFSLGEYGNLNYSSGYNGVHDVTFVDMKFNGGYSNVFTAATHGGGNIGLNHCKNIKFIGCQFSNIVNDHYIDIAGSENVVIRDCVFYGGVYLGSEAYEAINIDWSTQSGFPHFGVFDNTVSKNIWVDSCTFNDFTGTGNPCGIGTHDTTASLGGHRAIYILNNRFNDVHQAIHMLNAFDVFINGNYFEGCGAGPWPDPVDWFTVHCQAINGLSFCNNKARDTVYSLIKAENRGGTDNSYYGMLSICNNEVRHTNNGMFARVRYYTGISFNNNVMQGNLSGSYRTNNSYCQSMTFIGNSNANNGSFMSIDNSKDLVIMANSNDTGLNENIDASCSNIVHMAPRATTITNS